MKIYDYKYIKKIFNNDEISKFNLSNFNNLYNLDKLNFFIKIDSENSNFINLFFYISKINFYLFNKKIYIFKTCKNYNRGKSFIVFYIGQTFRNENLVNILDFIKNVINNMSMKIDNDLKIKNYNGYGLYNFKNINYLLGINNLIFYNMDINYNFILKYKNKIKNKNFYEKFFF